MGRGAAVDECMWDTAVLKGTYVVICIPLCVYIRVGWLKNTQLLTLSQCSCFPLSLSLRLPLLYTNFRGVSRILNEGFPNKGVLGGCPPGKF